MPFSQEKRGRDGRPVHGLTFGNKCVHSWHVSGKEETCGGTRVGFVLHVDTVCNIVGVLVGTATIKRNKTSLGSRLPYIYIHLGVQNNTTF